MDVVVKILKQLKIADLESFTCELYNITINNPHECAVKQRQKGIEKQWESLKTYQILQYQQIRGKTLEG